ncbi:MAG: sugar ABC transporter permease [Anaerolineae bacterium]|nr:sugar ABC transporter permease [Anaerolineae bacterium]
MAAQSRAAHPPGRFSRLTLRQRFYIVAILLLLPAVALRVFTAFYPFLQTAYLSLHKYNPAFDHNGPVFVGLNNFARIGSDPVVQASIGFTILFVVGATFFQLTLGLAVAHLLNAAFRLRYLARALVLIPWAIPMAVAALGFRWMFDDQFGIIPDLLRTIFGVQARWLIDPNNSKLAVVSVAVWKSTPFVALVLLAGLQGIGRDLYEAARVDGANAWTCLFYITIPMLMPILITTGMFMIVWQLAVFDLPFLMTGGGPGFSTTVIAQKIYLESNSLNYGYAASISMVLVGIVALVGVVGLYLFRRFDVSA